MFTKKAGYDRMPYPVKVIAFFKGFEATSWGRAITLPEPHPPGQFWKRVY